MTELFKASVPTAMNLLNDAKRETFAFGNIVPGIDAQITVAIPTPESILNQILVFSSPQQIENLNRTFNQLKNLCKKLESEILLLISQIDKILDKLERIESIFVSLDNFLKILADLVPVFRGTIIASNLVIGAQVTPVVSGAIIVRSQDLINLIKGKLKEIEALSRVATTLSTFILSTVEDIIDELLPVKSKLLDILSELRARCFYLDSVLIEKLQEFTEELDGNDINGLEANFNPEDIIDNLESTNKELFIEFLKENNATGYRIVRK